MERHHTCMTFLLLVARLSWTLTRAEPMLDQASASQTLMAELHDQQHPADCSQARLLVYDLSHLAGEGMGGVLIHAAGTVAQAYYEGRTAVLSDDPLPYEVPQSRCAGNQWECWLQPITVCRLSSAVTEAKIVNLRASFSVQGFPRHVNIQSKTSRKQFDDYLAQAMQSTDPNARLVYGHPLLNDAALYTCPPKYRDVVPDCNKWWAGEICGSSSACSPRCKRGWTCTWPRLAGVLAPSQCTSGVAMPSTTSPSTTWRGCSCSRSTTGPTTWPC